MTLADGAARIGLAALTAAIAAAAAIACLRVAAVGYYAQTDPERALRWNPASPAALMGAAEARALVAENDEQFRSVDDLARRALARAPLESGALRLMALEAERNGRDAQAVAMMDIAGQRTHRDILAQAWLMNRAFQARRFDSGLAHADSILRRAPEWSETLFPIMSEVFADPASRAPLQSFLATGPQWRLLFLAQLAADAEDPAALEALFGGLKAGPTPLTDEEAGMLVSRLINDGRYPEAQAAWRRLSPGSVAASETAVYDGGFRGAPGAPPFNWGLASAASSVAELVQAPDGAPALYVRFPAAEPTPLAEQLLVLAPGDYELSGRVRYGLRPPQRLAWRVQCADGEAIELKIQEQPADGGWRKFSARFTTPAQNCPGQWLQLGSQAEESFGMVDAWYADIAVRPAGGEG